VNSVFLLITVIHEFGVIVSTCYDLRWVFGEVYVGIGVVDSSCASLSCHLIPSISLPGIIYSGYELIYTWRHLFSTVF